MIPEELRYSQGHEWIKAEGKTGRIGISHYAQESLGSLVYVELPEVGTRVAAGESLGVVESVKAASDYYSPVAGTVTAVNGDLLDSPGLINDDPYGRGWIAEIEMEDPSEPDRLMDARAYADLLAQEIK